jgi:hypothetical protein
MRECTLQLSDALGTNRAEKQEHTRNLKTLTLRYFISKQIHMFTYHKAIRDPARLAERQLNVNLLFMACLTILTVIPST